MAREGLHIALRGGVVSALFPNESADRKPRQLQWSEGFSAFFTMMLRRNGARGFANCFARGLFLHCFKIKPPTEKSCLLEGSEVVSALLHSDVAKEWRLRVRTLLCAGLCGRGARTLFFSVLNACFHKQSDAFDCARIFLFPHFFSQMLQ